jgi:anti-sigma factor RsiW
VKDNTFIDHLSAEQLQALLEGDFPAGDLGRAEEHVAGCVRCSSELEAWSLLFGDLGALSSPAPNEGFAERVMARVEVSKRLPFAARIKEGLGFAPDHVAAHVAAAMLQDFSDGALPLKEAVGVKRHLDLCSECTTEAAAWTGIMNRLQGLDAFQPRTGFADRVMEQVDLPVAIPLAARIRSRVSSLVGAHTSEHVPEGLLQDFVEGALPGRAVARIQDHVDGCGRCASEADAWRDVVGQLEGLAAFSPSQGFAEQVMAHVSLEQPAVARRPATSRALAAAWRLVPQTREAWAALSGVAVTPAVITGLIFYAVFSHPTLTVGSLASFAWWQIIDLAAAGFAGFSIAAVQSAEVFGIYSLFESLAAAPMMVAGGVLAYSMVCALALRVLYRNLNPNRPVDGRYAHVSAS